MTEANQPPSRMPSTAINVLHLQPGTSIRLADDVTADIVSNPQDGIWLLVRYVSVPANASQEGTEDMVFAEDVVEVL